MKTVITLPLSKAERDAIPVALAAYEKGASAARAKYNKIESQAWTEYLKVRNDFLPGSEAAWTEYSKVRDVAWAECVKVREAALTEWGKACAASPLVAWIVGTFLEDREGEARAVLEALADDATMADLVVLAEQQEWCDAWDEALADASELFDIR